MKIKFAVITILFSVSLFAQSTLKQVKTNLDTLLANDYFKSTMMAIDVFDLTANQSLYKSNEKMLLKPASNMKILTTSAGLVFLGPEYPFTTDVKYSGKIINGTLYGDLYVIGGFDPDFKTKDVDSLASVIKAMGIHAITGKLYGDVSKFDTLFWGNGWMWDDDPSTDAPYLTSLNVNANTIGVIAKPNKIGEKPDVELVPSTQYCNVINSATVVPADSPSTFEITRDWINRTNKIIVKGNLPYKVIPDSLTDTVRVNVYDPQIYFMTLLNESLNRKGIKTSNKIDTLTTPSYAQDIFEYIRPFDSVIVNLNKISYNLGAEMTMYAMGYKYFGGPATAENGIKLTDSLITLSGLNPKDYRLVDGSGVSHYNLVTAELLMSVLKYIHNEKPELYKILYKSFPIAGVDGSLMHRMRKTPAQGNVHAKTGTLSGVCSLSGYLTARNGHLIAFSLITENYVGSSRRGRNFQDEICNILVDYN